MKDQTGNFPIIFFLSSVFPFFFFYCVLFFLLERHHLFLSFFPCSGHQHQHQQPSSHHEPTASPAEAASSSNKDSLLQRWSRTATVLDVRPVFWHQFRPILDSFESSLWVLQFFQLESLRSVAGSSRNWGRSLIALVDFKLFLGCFGAVNGCFVFN